MIYNISGEQPFQVLSDSFSVSPSQSGYDLYLSADGFNYSRFATVASGTTKQFTGMNNGNYYILSGNTSEVKVNWERECGGGGGGAAGVSSLDGQTGALTTKTINGNAILGSGDIEVGGGVAQYNLDAMTQAERLALYEELSGETTASTVNEEKIFIKDFNPLHGGNQVPFRVQFMGNYSNKIRFGCCRPNEGHPGEIWGLTVDINDDGSMTADMAPNYSGDANINSWGRNGTFKASVDTGGTITMDEDRIRDLAYDIYTACYYGAMDAKAYANQFSIVIDDANGQFYYGAINFYATSSSIVQDAIGFWFDYIDRNGITWRTKWTWDGTNATLVSKVKVPNVQDISQADYDALVQAGTVDANTLYVII